MREQRPSSCARFVIEAPAEIGAQQILLAGSCLRTHLQKFPAPYKISAQVGREIEFRSDRIARCRVGLTKF